MSDEIFDDLNMSESEIPSEEPIYDDAAYDETAYAEDGAYDEAAYVEDGAYDETAYADETYTEDAAYDETGYDTYNDLAMTDENGNYLNTDTITEEDGEVGLPMKLTVRRNNQKMLVPTKLTFQGRNYKIVSIDSVKNQPYKLDKDGNVKMHKKGKPVKRMKGWQKGVIAACAVVFTIGIAAGVFLGVMGGGGGPAAGVSNAIVTLDMVERGKYFLGTEGAATLSQAFPNQTVSVVGGNVTISGDAMTATGKGTGKIKVGDKEVDVTIVDGGRNVNSYDEFYQAINVDGVPAVLHHNHKDLDMTKKELPANLKEVNDAIQAEADALKTDSFVKYSSGTLYPIADVYGNGANINAHEVSKSTPSDDFWWGVGGNHAFHVMNTKWRPFTEEVTISDMRVFGKINGVDNGDEEGKAAGKDNIKSYTNYGSMLKIGDRAAGVGYEISDENRKTKAKVVHSVFEKAAKTVYIVNSSVKMEDCLVRDASDTTISIGTYANSTSNINLDDVVVSDSLTAGILFYCYDGAINGQNAKNTWNYLTMKDKVEVFNWKKANGLKFLPDTEAASLSQTLVDMANTLAGSEITKKKNAEMRVDDEETKESYVHFGILKICTSSYGKNESQIKTPLDAYGYEGAKLPLPQAAALILKVTYLWSYYNNDQGDVPHNKSLSESIVLNDDTKGFVITDPDAKK